MISPLADRLFGPPARSLTLSLTCARGRLLARVGTRTPAAPSLMQLANRPSGAQRIDRVRRQRSRANSPANSCEGTWLVYPNEEAAAAAQSPCMGMSFGSPSISRQLERLGRARLIGPSGLVGWLAVWPASTQEAKGRDGVSGGRRLPAGRAEPPMASVGAAMSQRATNSTNSAQESWPRLARHCALGTRAKFCRTTGWLARSLAGSQAASRDAQETKVRRRTM